MSFPRLRPVVLVCSSLCWTPAVRADLPPPEPTPTPVHFAFPVQGQDTFTFQRGYPIMSAPGDAVSGTRETPDLAFVNNLSLQLAFDQSAQACDGQLSFTFDGSVFGYTTLTAGKDIIYVRASNLRLPAASVVRTTTHSIEVALLTDLWACASGSAVRFLEDESWIELSMVQDDLDDDGAYSIATLGDDCNDLNAGVHPGATEACNGIDDDCDGGVDEGFDRDTRWPDADGDGYGAEGQGQPRCADAPGLVSVGGDCDDADEDVYPGAAEICGDGLDQDCSGVADDEDLDGDGHGDPACGAGDDCDDTNEDVSPDAAELCGDRIDQDCSGALDDADLDGDGAVASACGGADCDDEDARVGPGEVEAEDGDDDDCDGRIDEGTGAWDGDGDGFTPNDGDCDDADGAISPAGVEPGQLGVDDDCDGRIDEEAAPATPTPTAEATPTEVSSNLTPQEACGCASGRRPTEGLFSLLLGLLVVLHRRR